MATPTGQRPYAGGRLSDWSGGVDNRQPDYELPANVLRDAVNVDVLTNGAIRRRKGIIQRRVDAGAHSLYSDGAKLYWATATALKSAGNDFVPTTLLTDTRLASPLSYTTVHGITFFSNEAISGTITAAGIHAPWGIAPPAAAPTVTGPGGDRLYQVTCTFVLATGEESGAPRGATAFASDDDQSLVVTAIPQPTDSRVTAVRLYSTAIDGEIFYQHTDLPVGVTSCTLSAPHGRGQTLRTQFCAPPPPGQLVEHLNGRLYVASGNVLWITEPLNYGLVDLRQGFVMFSERITLVAAAVDGLYVSADRTYFLRAPGTPEMALEWILPYKAVERTSMEVPNSQNVIWFSERGFVIGSPGGQAVNPSEGKVAVEQARAGCIGIVERDGDKRFVAVIPDGTDSPLAAADFIEGRQAQIDEVR